MYETLSALPPLPPMSGVLFFDPRGSIEGAVMKRLKALKKPAVLDLLADHFLPWMITLPAHSDVGLNNAKKGLVEWILKKAPIPCSTLWQNKVFSYPIIPLPSLDEESRYRCLDGMVDPTSEIAQLYNKDEGLFPCPAFFARHKETLIAYGILSKPLWSTPLDRVRYFSQNPGEINDKKVEALLKLPISQLSRSKELVAEIQEQEWLPALSVAGESVILAPKDCRSKDESDLVDFVLGITAIPVLPSWKKLFGKRLCVVPI